MQPIPRRLSWLRTLHQRLHENAVTGFVTKIAVTGVGLVVIGAGLVMMVTPGPGVVAILVGLAILATEWKWARHTLQWLRSKAAAAAEKTGVDSAQRRRRMRAGLAVAVVLVGGVATYVVVAGWPRFAVRSWDWLQDISALVPELPGM
jgi:uncharacterized protein (TIGR02611 family)